MNSSEDMLTIHNSASYNQQNGDVLSTYNDSSSRATMENIKSVHENPFYKNFGIKHSSQLYARPVNRSGGHEQAKHISSNGRSFSVDDDDDDDIGEYRPGSGYVHKLLDKFSSLTAREEQSINVTHLKRSSSLDELPVDNEAVKDNPSISRASGYEKPSFLSVAKLSHRARSIENLNHSHHKPHHSFAVTLRHVETNWDRDRQSVSSKSQRDSHIAPDAELARNDIIIIENELVVSPLKDLRENESNDGVPIVVGNNELVLQDEMPKPNTVLNVRSIFESAFAGSGLYTRRQKLDSPLSPSSVSVRLGLSSLQTAQDGINNRVGLQSPPSVTSPRLSSDTHARHVLQSSKGDNLRHMSDSHLHSRPEVPMPSTSIILSNSGTHISRSHISSQQHHHSDDKLISPSDFNSGQSADGKIHSFDRGNSFEATEFLDSLHHTTASHITAGDKVTGKHDELPVMIFTTSNLRSKKDKSQRTRDYTQPNNFSRGVANEGTETEEDINPKEINNLVADDCGKSTPETSNKVLSHISMFNSSSKNADTYKNDQSKIIYTKQRTTIEVKNTPKNSLDRKQFSMKDKSKHTENEAEVKPVNTAAFSNTNIINSRTRAAEPSVLSGSQTVSLDTDDFERNKRQVTHSLTSKAQPANEKPINNSQNSIFSSEESLPELHREKSATSKRSHPNDAALNEQPLNKVSKDKPDSIDQPVKGIPSIIAQRLKKQHSDPSQAADVINSSDFTVASDGNIYSRSHLTSPSPNNNEKDSLSSEIENEIATVRKKMEGSRSKSAGPAPIFDSSQLSKKRKEKKKQQASLSQELVPSLDLSGIADDHTMEYQSLPKRIPPCNIVFIGENTATSRSLLIKQRKIKISIHFNDAKTETFEYPNETVALEKYLEDHPHETEEILVLEDFSGGGDESSDDLEIDVFETPVTPRGNTDDDLLKSNTALAHTGSLQSYRGRYQQDYELGTIIIEKPEKPDESEPAVDPEKLMLRPADEEDTSTWSTSSTSDILF